MPSRLEVDPVEASVDSESSEHAVLGPIAVAGSDVDGATFEM